MKKIKLERKPDCMVDFTSNGVKVKVIYGKEIEFADIKIHAKIYFDAPMGDAFSESTQYPALLMINIYSNAFTGKRDLSRLENLTTSVDEQTVKINETISKKLKKMLDARRTQVKRITENNALLAKFVNT